MVLTTGNAIWSKMTESGFRPRLGKSRTQCERLKGDFMLQAPVGAAHRAGPGGSATAPHLARRGSQAARLRKSEFFREQVCGDRLRRRAGSQQQHLVGVSSVGVTDNGKRRNG